MEQLIGLSMALSAPVGFATQWIKKALENKGYLFDPRWVAIGISALVVVALALILRVDVTPDNLKAIIDLVIGLGGSALTALGGATVGHTVVKGGPTFRKTFRNTDNQ